MKPSAGYRILKRPDVLEYLASIDAAATERAGITAQDVIAKALQLFEVAMCRQPYSTDGEGGPLYLPAPNLAIAAKMVGMLGDATKAWGESDAVRPANGVNVFIGDGSRGGLADVMIERIQPGKAIEHQPEGE